MDPFRIRSIKVLFPFALAIAAMNSACVKHSPSESATADTIVIGEVSSMTGPEATYGLSAHSGMSLAIQEANEAGGIQGKKVKLVTVDSQGKPDESARGISKLISQERVVAVLTGVISSNALAMSSIAQKHRVPMVNTIATHPKVTEQGDQIYRVCLMDSFQGTVMGKFALENLKVKKVAILRDVKSDYSVGLAETFTSVLKAGGGEVVMNQTYSAGDIDFKAQLTAIRGKKPEAIYLPGYYTDVSLIARQIRELGMDTPLLGGDGWDSPKLHEIGGEALTGGYFSSHYSAENPTPGLQKFLSNYQTTFKTLPDGLAVMGYEGGQILVQALKKAKTLDSDGIRDAMAQVQGIETVTGKVTFDSKRNAMRAAVVLRIEKDGRLRYQATVNP